MSPFLERMHPETPCQIGEHHPHRMVCGDIDDDCWDEWRPDKYEPYNILTCCIDGQEWPCRTKVQHEIYRKAVAVWRGTSGGALDRGGATTGVSNGTNR